MLTVCLDICLTLICLVLKDKISKHILMMYQVALFAPFMHFFTPMFAVLLDLWTEAEIFFF